MEKNYSKYGYWYILPFFIIFIIFSIYPIYYTLYLSFTYYRGTGSPDWVGLRNYVWVLEDRKFYLSLANTIRIWGVNIVLQLGTALFLVMIFSDLKYKLKGLKMFRIIFYLPNLIAAASVAILFSQLLDKYYGVVNTMLLRFGIFDSINDVIGWLTEALYAQLSVSLIQTWMWFGNSFILFMASIQAVNKETIEASVIDGANRFQILTKIKLPLIKPILIYVGITSLIGGLQLFDVPYLLQDTGHANEALTTVIGYLFSHFSKQNYGYAAAIAFVLFVIIFIVSMFFLLVVNFDKVKAFSAKRQQERLEKKLNMEVK